jgi:serine/threonine protein phosphatase PrpC
MGGHGPVKAAHHTRNGMTHQRHGSVDNVTTNDGARVSSEQRSFNANG